MANKNTVTIEQIEKIYEQSEKQINVLWNKCTVMAVQLENGFTIVVHSACVYPKNFDEQIGIDICKEKVMNKLWELEGYKLQCELGKLY